MQIDMTKLDQRKDLVLNLKKGLGIEEEKAEVVLALDFSGSMRSMYRDGTVQELLERILALAMNFDDDGKIPFYLFHQNFIQMPDIQISNINTIVESTNKHSMGSTSYAPVLDKIVKDQVGTMKVGGTLGFGKKDVYDTKSADIPSYVIFVTDGNNDDKANARRVITEASKCGVFFQFVGIGAEAFTFLKELDTMQGRAVDNANFFEVRDLKSITDNELYSKLLYEYPSWLKDARNANIVK